MSPRARQATVRVLIVLASILAVLALVAGYVRRAVVDSNQFANRATAALHDDSVRGLIADKITDDVVLRNESDLIAARPIIQSGASAIIGSRAFTGLFRAAVRDVHRALFDRDRDSVTLTLADVGTVLSAALEKLEPSLARKVRATEKAELVKGDLGSLGADLARLADRIRSLAILVTILTVLAAAVALLLSRDRRRTTVELGLGVAVGGVLLIVAYGIMRTVAIDQVEGPEDRAAVGAVWDAFLGDLRTAAWLFAGSGAVIAAAAASLIKPVDIREPLRRAFAWVATEPKRTELKVLRGICFVAAGLILIVQRDAVLRLLFTIAGVYLIYVGVTAILRLVYSGPVAREERREVAVRARERRRRVAVPMIAAAIIAVAVVLFVGTGGTTTAAPARGACDGHSELCDRPLDEVVLPATHNSMSVPLPGWYSAEQERPIGDQLSDGIRGLLIDTHYGDRLPDGKVRTYVGSREQLRRQVEQDGVSPDAVNAAMRIRERAGFKGEGERGIYLCHTACELGATPLASVLDDIQAFLVSHPDDVLVVINQDYVTPKDFVAAVEKAGLADLAYDGSTSDWPTLGEMIERDQRIVFLAENKAGAAPWYRLAYQEITQETPYSFSKVSQLTRREELPASCKPNRGLDTAPLFLLNHWITTDPFPLPSNARKVNRYEPFLRRAEQCQRIRKKLPNLLAVNFYREGDLFRVVDRLNGVR